MRSKFKQIIKTRLPKLAKRFSKQNILNIDLVCIYDDRLIISGWYADKLVAVSSSALKVKNLEYSIHTFERSDVINAIGLQSSEQCFGFIMIVECSSEDIEQCVFESGKLSLKLSDLRYSVAHNATEILAHVPVDREKAARFLTSKGFEVDLNAQASQTKKRKLDKDVAKIKSILDGVNIHDKDFFDVAKKHALPEIQRIWKSRLAKFKTSEVQVLGNEIADPEITIIIPLYGRFDFMQHQIAQFAQDRTLSSVEVIYVVDDPEISRIVNLTAIGVFQIFGFPFKVVYSDFNRGFSGANNLGVEYARGTKVLLLNSDIIPQKAGWVKELQTQYDSIENCGLLGATLLYEDETIQHAGMEFREDSHYPGILMNHHPYKGVPVELLPLEPLFESQIVTGACMLIDTSLYRNIGGFDPLYVLGDFEDSDLCLKVRKEGLNIYCSSTVRLYHLERLSQNLVDQGDWKFKLTLVNGIYQMNKWSSLIKDNVK